MKFLEKVKNKWQTFWQSIKPRNDGSSDKFRTLYTWVYKLRSVFLAIPVGAVAVIMAVNNSVQLPDSVALVIPAFTKSGDVVLETLYLAKSVAVMGPLAVTALCLLLMFCSRRVAYPWLISVFSLVLPLFLHFSCIFPG